MNTTLLSILTGLGGMIGWGAYDFLGGVFAKRIGPFRSLFWSQAAGLICVIVPVLVMRTQVRAPGMAVALSALAAVFYSTGYLYFFKGLEKGNVSLNAAAMNLWAVFTMFFAFVFMGQRLGPAQTLGVTMIISGAALAAVDWGSLRAGGLQVSAGVRETILGAFFFGIYWNVSEIISENIGWLLTTLFIKAGIVLFLLFFALAARREIGIGGSPTATKWAIFFMGLVEAGAVAVVNFGLTIGDAILITPIASALSIVTIALAVLFLKDRISKVQAFGMLLAAAGMIAAAF